MFKWIELSSFTGTPKNTKPYDKLIEGEWNKFNSLPQHSDWGMVPDVGYVVLDIDDQLESDLLFSYLMINKVKFNCLQTTRGKHFWFKTNNTLLNNVGYRNGLGIKCDVRCGGKNCYLRFTKNGVQRQWLTWYGNDIDFLDDILIPAKPLNDVDYSGQTEGRNNTLFKLISKWTHLGYSREQKDKCIDFINNNLFYEPLSDHELGILLKNHKDYEKQGKYEIEQYETWLMNNELYTVSYIWDNNTKTKKITNMVKKVVQN